jgi:inhibitor of cysteine peptidase
VLRGGVAALADTAREGIDVAQINLDRSDGGRTCSGSPGDVVVIRLDETPTSGFRWQVDECDLSVLRPAGDSFRPAEGAGTGGGGTREFRFAVVGARRGGVRLALRRAWESESPPADRFEATINAAH